jgi:hypothetical protein
MLTKNALQMQCFPGRRVVQVIFQEDELLVCSDDFRVKYLMNTKGQVPMVQ